MTPLPRSVAGGRTAAAFALLLGLAGAAEAQFRTEQVGEWDGVSGETWRFFVIATPNTRAARAYCSWSTLRGAFSEDVLKLTPEAEKIGTSKDYACLRLGCGPQGHRHEFEFTIFANAAPLADSSAPLSGASLRMRFAPNEEPIVLFDRADHQQLSRDGNLELVTWSVSRPRAGVDGNYVEARVMLSASSAFIEQLAAKQKAEFELMPWESRGERERHAGRTVALTLTGIADVAAELRRTCAPRRRN